MKVHWLAFLIVLGAVLLAPAVSAKIIEEKDGYIVSSVDERPVFTDLASAFGSFSITQGQTAYHSTVVPSGMTAFSPVLAWGSTTNSLALRVTAPDMEFGPYYDSSDGITDGRIGLRISRAGGLTGGTWRSTVYGYRVTGSQAYTYQVGLT